MHRKSAVPKHKNTKRTGASPILSKIIEKGPQYEVLSRFFYFSSANAIANADIRSIRKCFEFKGRGGRISLSAEQLKKDAMLLFRGTAQLVRFNSVIFKNITYF